MVLSFNLAKFGIRQGPLHLIAVVTKSISVRYINFIVYIIIIFIDNINNLKHFGIVNMIYHIKLLLDLFPSPRKIVL
jgi:hypothetical protein